MNLIYKGTSKGLLCKVYDKSLRNVTIVSSMAIRLYLEVHNAIYFNTFIHEWPILHTGDLYVLKVCKALICWTHTNLTYDMSDKPFQRKCSSTVPSYNHTELNVFNLLFTLYLYMYNISKSKPSYTRTFITIRRQKHL